MNQEHLIPVMVGATILFLLFLFFIIAYIIIHSRRQQRNRMEKVQMIFDHQKNLLGARLEEQERAMTQISKEIHDNVAQKTDFIHMNIKALAEEHPRDDQLRYISNSQSLLEHVTNDLRNISYSLNSDYIKARGLGEVLSKELEYIQSARKISSELQITGLYKSLQGDQELLLYRIVQEALHNAMKYSQASKIIIALQYEPDRLTMEIRDNGIGFDQKTQNIMNGLGFKNMRQRADLLHAAIEVTSAPAQGCCIQLSMPLVAGS